MNEWFLDVRPGEWVYLRNVWDGIDRYKVTKVTKTQIVTRPRSVDKRFRRDDGRQIGGGQGLLRPTQEVLDQYEAQVLWARTKGLFAEGVKPEFLPALREAARILGLKGVEVREDEDHTSYSRFIR